MFYPLAWLDALNSREDAALFWVVITAVVLLSKVPALRPQIVLVIRSFLSPKLLLGIWIPATVYVLALLYVADREGVWHTSSTKETVYWFAGTALVLAGGATQASDTAKFRNLFGRVLKVIIFIEFLVNLCVFPLAVEIVLIPLIVVFGGMHAVAKLDPKFASVRKLIGFILSVVGIVLVTHAVTSALQDLDGLFTWEHAEQFLAPLVLTIAFVPFLFYVALWSTYELVFMRVNIFVKNKRLARRTKWAIIGNCGLSLRRIGRFHGQFFGMLRTVCADADVTALMREFKAALRAEDAERSRSDRKLRRLQPLSTSTDTVTDSRDAA